MTDISNFVRVEYRVTGDFDEVNTYHKIINAANLATFVKQIKDNIENNNKNYAEFTKLNWVRVSDIEIKTVKGVEELFFTNERDFA